MKKHFRILLGVGSAKKSSAPYALQVLRAHGAECLLSRYCCCFVGGGCRV